MIGWLEETALVAGIGHFLETPQQNDLARAFYGAMGYREIQTVPRYYEGRDSAVRMLHDLWEHD